MDDTALTEIREDGALHHVDLIMELAMTYSLTDTEAAGLIVDQIHTLTRCHGAEAISLDSEHVTAAGAERIRLAFDRTYTDAGTLITEGTDCHAQIKALPAGWDSWQVAVYPHDHGQPASYTAADTLEDARLIAISLVEGQQR